MSDDPPGYRPPAKPPTDAIHRTDVPVRRPTPSKPAAPTPAEKPPREIQVFAAEPAPPKPASTKLAIGGGVAVALYLAYWISTSFTASAFKDRLTTIPVESYGQTAKYIGEGIVEEGKRRGITVRLEDVRVEIGPDSALGRMVKMDVRYRRLLLPSKKLHQEVRCPNPLQPGVWNGATLVSAPPGR